MVLGQWVEGARTVGERYKDSGWTIILYFITRAGQSMYHSKAHTIKMKGHSAHCDMVARGKLVMQPPD
jgi:hypothetical protein